MQYIIEVGESPEEMELYAAPVAESDAEYLRQAGKYFMPLSREQITHGLAVIFQTGTRYSYVIDQDELLVCIEWQPGLLIIKVSEQQEFKWMALRSPIPNFGGRVPLPEDGDPDEYDDLDNPQYNLVFTPWDAQFDPDEREYYGFSPAGSDVEEQFERLRGRFDSMAQPAPSFDHPDYERWRRKCIENLNQWTGIGVRL